MKQLSAMLIISMLGFLPTIVGAAGPSPMGKQSPEQRRLLTKDQI